MKSLYIIANWKSNKDSEGAKKWFEEISSYLKDQVFENKEIIICPSFTLLSLAREMIQNKNLPFKLGAQDMSFFEEGPYTGEVNVKQVKDYVTYVIVGHSERRKNFNEDDEKVKKKLDLAKENSLIPILCVQGESLLAKESFLVAYEPEFAIGTGTPDTPENANLVALTLRTKFQAQKVLYGGSVNSQNVKSFVSQENIDGVLVGTSSLDPLEFFNIIKNA